jgi:uncharacterized protein YegP (UPF0339 family)
VDVVRNVEVIKEVPVDRIVEVIKEVPVDRIVEVERIVEVDVVRNVEVIKEVPVDRIVEVIKEVPVDRIVEVERIVEVDVVRNVEVVREVASLMDTETASRSASQQRSYRSYMSSEDANIRNYSYAYLNTGDYAGVRYYYWLDDDNLYYFYFADADGNILLQSVGFETAEACSAAITYVTEHANNMEYYLRYNLGNRYHFYYFRNDEDMILATSPRYGSYADMSGRMMRLVGKPRRDDLKIVEGIGPKIEGIFNEAGIYTWRQLSKTEPAVLKALLEAAGPRYKMHNPATWPRQAGYAADGLFAELKVWQDAMSGGKDTE